MDWAKKHDEPFEAWGLETPLGKVHIHHYVKVGYVVYGPDVFHEIRPLSYESLELAQRFVERKLVDVHKSLAAYLQSKGLV